MSDGLEMSIFLPVSPERLYSAWLDTDEHGAFTGSEARVDPHVGGIFRAWEGYISGRTLELEPFRRIVQAWRTTDFPEKSPDSRLEVLFEARNGGTELTLVHTMIPEGQTADYEKGWKEFYFDPMTAWCSTL